MLENLTNDEFESVFAGNRNKFMIATFNPELFGLVIINYLMDKEKQISLYTNNLLKQQSENFKD